MGSSTRAFLLGIALVVLVLPVVAAAAARFGSTALRVACPTRAFSIDFRPKGSVASP